MDKGLAEYHIILAVLHCEYDLRSRNNCLDKDIMLINGHFGKMLLLIAVDLVKQAVHCSTNH